MGDGDIAGGPASYMASLEDIVSDDSGHCDEQVFLFREVVQKIILLQGQYYGRLPGMEVPVLLDSSRVFVAFFAQ